MDVLQFLLARGGAARTSTLREAGFTRWDLRSAVVEGLVQRIGQGAYQVTVWDVDGLDRAIAITGGVASHDTAAVLHLLPFTDALVIADSALRQEKLRKDELHGAARRARGRGADMLRRVAEHCDPLADSVPESLVRGLCIENGMPPERTQLRFAFRSEARLLRCVVDLAWPSKRLVVEIDGWEFHRTRERFQKDRRVSNGFVLDHWTILRFTWVDIMDDSDYVLTCLRRVLKE